MSKKLKLFIYSIIAVFLLLFGALIASNIIIKNKIERFTKEQLPKNITVTFEEVSLHLLKGTLTYSDVSVTLQNKSNDTTHTYLTAGKVLVENLSYWDYLTKEEIHIEDIKIKSPSIQYYKNLLVTVKDTTTRKALLKLAKPLIVDKLSIENARLTFFNTAKKDTLLHLTNASVGVSAIYIDNSTLKNRLPVNFDTYQAQVDSIFLRVSNFENLTVGDLKIEDRKATANRIHLATKYGKAEHASLLEQERDHFNVVIKKLEVNEIDFGFNNRIFFAKSSLIKLEEVDATIYRNKLVADDPTTKPLYSKMLRDLPIDLTVDSLALTNSAITYQEKAHKDHPPGTIHFDEFKAAISNLSNTYGQGKKTTVAVTSRFMRTAPLEVDWSFDVNNTEDKFIFRADLGALPAEEMNPFTRPNLNVALAGETQKTYLSIYGSRNHATIDMRIDYENFKVNLLQDDGKKEKKLLSGLLNIFVNKESGGSESKFSKCSAEATPDQTKSFFNYVWKNISAALKACLL